MNAMETDYLNFHDVGQFPEFSSNFDQYDFSDDAQKLQMVIDDDFDYSQSQLPQENFWEIEQELNGDMAVLPASGVSSQMPKIENMNQDFVNTFNDWSEHLGTLQEYESNNELIALQNNLPVSLNDSFSEMFNETDALYMSTEQIPEDVKLIPSLIKNFPELPPVYLTSPVKESSVSIKVESESEEKDLIEVKENFDDWADKEEGCIDVETVSEHQPVLEARDVTSLLEQFEANLDLINPNPTKKNTKSRQASCEINKVTNQSKDISKSLESTEPQVSERHKNIRDSLPKEVIDRINASARKKVISVIPALSTNTKNNSRNNKRATKATSSTRKNSKAVSQNISVLDTVVQNDHTYCTNSSNNNNSNNNSNHASNHNSTGNASKTGKGKQGGKKLINSKVKKLVQNHRNNLIKRMDSWTDSSSKKDSGLESGDGSDASEELATKNSVNSNDQKNQLCNKQSSANNSVPVNKIINVDNKKNQAKPVSGMKIQSALATSILQMRNGVLTKTKSVDENTLKGKMVSVLKKPPVNKLIGVNESIITTKNSLNDDVQNIIVQDTSLISTSSSTSSLVNENEKKPPKRKLNLAEYRSRRDQNSSGNSRTCSPIQPMTLIYIHHASTSTDPLTTDSDNPTWSEREIVSMLKPKKMIDEPRIKPVMCDASVQTYETVFDHPNSSDVIVEKPEVEASVTLTDVKGVNGEKISLVEKDPAFGKKRNYRQRRTSSSSRSRSRSRSRSSNSIRSRSKKERQADSRKRVSRSRSHNKYKTNKRRSSSSRSRSRSRSRSSSRSRSRSWSLSSRRNIRRRKISHRRSSVSSNSSWSSRSISRSTYRSRSFSRSSRSRSRSRSSGSTSRSRSRYSSSTRYCKYKSERNERSGQRKRSRTRTTDYRRRRYSSERSNNYYNNRRSPSYTRNSYNNTWHNHEKTRQVEERRVIYVGRIDEGITKADLRKRFEAFGPVTDISLHFREHGDNYGFVTFANKHDAYNAVEHGNDNPALPRYDLSFGGRRAFCKVKYADLDGAPNSSYSTGRSVLNSNNEDNSFDFLLKEVQAKLRNRKV